MNEIADETPSERRVLVIAHHTLLGEGIACLLERQPGFRTQRAVSIGEALEIASQWHPHVVLAATRQGDASALQTVRGFRDEPLNCSVIIMSEEDDDGALFLATLGEGARGFLGPDADAKRLVRSINDVAEGRLAIGNGLVDRLASEYISKLHGRRASARGPQTYVTERELEILRRLSRGMTNGAIARELFLSENTVRAHVRNIALKLDAENRVQAVARAVNLGLLAAPHSAPTPLPG